MGLKQVQKEQFYPLFICLIWVQACMKTSSTFRLEFVAITIESRLSSTVIVTFHKERQKEHIAQWGQNQFRRSNFTLCLFVCLFAINCLIWVQAQMKASPFFRLKFVDIAIESRLPSTVIVTFHKERQKEHSAQWG